MLQEFFVKDLAETIENDDIYNIMNKRMFYCNMLFSKRKSIKKFFWFKIKKNNKNRMLSLHLWFKYFKCSFHKCLYIKIYSKSSFS